MTNLNFTDEDNQAVEWCEKEYPELTQEYKNYDGTIYFVL